MPFAPILVLFSVDVSLGTGMTINIRCYSGNLILISNCVLLHTIHTRQVMYAQCNVQACCCGKAVSITSTECVSVALGIQHAQCTRSIILLSVACLAQPHFSTFPKKRHLFLGGGLNMMCACVCVFWFFQQLSLKHFSFYEEPSTILL